MDEVITAVVQANTRFTVTRIGSAIGHPIASRQSVTIIELNRFICRIDLSGRIKICGVDHYRARIRTSNRIGII